MRDPQGLSQPVSAADPGPPRLADLRGKAKLTQAQAAEKVGITNETLSRIERGKQWTDFKTLSALARLYKVEWADLMAVYPKVAGAKQRAVIQEVVDLLRPRKLSEVERARNILVELFKASK